MARSLGAIAKALAGIPHHLIGAPDVLIQRLAPLETAGPHDIAFVSNVRYRAQLASTRAACVIVSPALQVEAERRGACIVTGDPYLFFARLTQWWKVEHGVAAPVSVHASAQIDPSADVDASASIGAGAVVEAGAVIEAGAIIGAQCVIGAGARIGRDTRLYPRVTVYEGCHLGERCVVHSGAVIGADGFGFAPTPQGWVKIEQLGAVRIGNDVEIGANTCIDRGALDDTVIEDGVKLDNLVQIGHNVRVGVHTAMAGCVGVAGSARIGAQCTLGGGAIVLGHLSLADGVHVSAASVVTRSIHTPGQYTGMFPIDDNASWEKNAASLKQLNKLRERLKAVESALAQLHTPDTP